VNPMRCFLDVFSIHFATTTYCARNKNNHNMYGFQPSLRQILIQLTNGVE